MTTELVSEGTSPAERRRLKVRSSILEAAERVFAGEGEEGLSIRRLAEEIDYSPAAIYKYFGSKEELIDELKEAFFERLLMRIDEIRGCEAPFAQRARDCVKIYIATALERPHHYAAAFSSVDPVHDGGAPAVSAAQMDWESFTTSKKGRAFRHLIDMVREGQEGGAFSRTLNPFLAAKSVWAASHGLAQLMTHIPHFPAMLPDDADMSADDFIAFHADVIMRGLEIHTTDAG